MRVKSVQAQRQNLQCLSLAQDDDVVMVVSLSSSEEEKFAFTAQSTTSQPIGTQSEK